MPRERALPAVKLEPTAPGCTAEVVLAGRATSVPFTAVLTGPQRTPMDNTIGAKTCACSPSPQVAIRIWLWEQGVAGSNPAVPTVGLVDGGDSTFDATSG